MVKHQIRLVVSHWRTRLVRQCCVNQSNCVYKKCFSIYTYAVTFSYIVAVYACNESYLLFQNIWYCIYRSLYNWQLERKISEENTISIKETVYHPNIYTVLTQSPYRMSFHIANQRIFTEKQFSSGLSIIFWFSAGLSSIGERVPLQ